MYIYIHIFIYVYIHTYIPILQSSEPGTSSKLRDWSLEIEVPERPSKRVLILHHMATPPCLGTLTRIPLPSNLDLTLSHVP